MEAYMRGVSRALTVLRELNINNGASILELHRATGISRPSLYRIVRTLEKTGYLTSDERTQSYRLTPLVKGLSEGFSQDSWIADIAGPVLDDLQKQVVWPTDLFSFFDDTMVMLRTTRRASPWTIDRAMVGLRIPLLITACGRAYLANLPDKVLQGVLQRLKRSKHADDAMARDPRAVDKLLTKVRRDGYAFRERGFMKETGSIAVPVLHDGAAYCSIAITYISSALSASDVIDRYAPLLHRAAADIASGIQANKALN
jgi:IclR family transcriptional regulator, mhp operon transcriptional activator